ncbi:MAG: DUF4097 family beta strand repeat-containing protein [Imperialibacter sp.]
MKAITMGLVMFLGSMTSLLAQYTTEANSPVKAGQKIYLEFDFSSVIKINHWDQQEAKAVLSVEEKEDWPTPEFTISVDNTTSALSMYMKKQQFEDYWKKQKGGRENCYCSTPTMTVEVWLPKGVDISVKSISADIETTFEGGELTLETISGDVDIKLPASQNVSLKASTISGDIYSDLTFEYLDGGKGLKEIVGVKLDAKLNNGGKNLQLKSISGDILLRRL